MKKYALHLSKCLIVMVLTLTTVFQSIQAQEPNPSTWNSFINSAVNPIVSDTFRMQTFGGKETDNWKFELLGGAEVTDRPTLKLPLGSKIEFEPYSLDKYTGDTIVGVSIAFSQIRPTEKLFFKVFRQNTLQSLTAIAPVKNDSTSSYKTKLITKRPTSLSIEVSQPASNSLQGYFATNCVYAFGNIPQYSLFTGTGNWNDTVRWSHLPPLRHRKALINGNIGINVNTQCQNTTLSNGSLHISSATILVTDNLNLYNENSTVSSEGDIIVNEQLTIHKTFAEKDKWYFISFPFDVYSRNIDSRFQQKDATPNNGGNYFYVQTYNGEKRAINNQTSGNWEVLPIRSGNIPVFEKNKGYLIALDEKATDRTLKFSSKPRDIPSDFARNGLISIPIAPFTESTNKENYGWYLCGNPFPCPLELSQLADCGTLDGNIYLFQNGEYKIYSLKSNYAILPYAAFFVKSSGPTEINITHNPTLKSDKLLQPSVFSYQLMSEPATESFTTEISKKTQLGYSVKNRTLTLENIPCNGYIEIFTITGNCLLKQVIQPGNSDIPLSLKAGIYLFKFSTPQKQETRKFIIL